MVVTASLRSPWCRKDSSCLLHMINNYGGDKYVKSLPKCRQKTTVRVGFHLDTDVVLTWHQEVIKLVAWYGVYLYHHRPRGWSRNDLLEIKCSSLGESAGMGVFSKQNIVANTVLGAYPGLVRDDMDMTAKSIVAPMSRYYCFSTRPGCILDPTGKDGYPSARPMPPSGALCWWPCATDTMLSYVNEPSINQQVSVNVRVEDDPHDPLIGLLFIADRNIAVGEELFIDYGTAYDRSLYQQ